MDKGKDKQYFEINRHDLLIVITSYSIHYTKLYEFVDNFEDYSR